MKEKEAENTDVKQTRSVLYEIIKNLSIYESLAQDFEKLDLDVMFQEFAVVSTKRNNAIKV